MPEARAETLQIRGGIQGQIAGILSGFATGGHSLDQVHKHWLDDHVIPLIIRGGSIFVQGWASPIGSEATNLALSQRRAQAVLSYVRQQANRAFQSRFSGGTGEDFARQAGARENSNAAFYRGALVSAWPRRNPPPPPSPPLSRTRRIVFRRWVDSNLPPLPGEDDALAQLISHWLSQAYARFTGRQDNPSGREMTGDRRYEQVIQTFRVNVIEVHATVDFRRVARGVAVYETTDVTYRWGEPRPHVEIRRTQESSGVGQGIAPAQERRVRTETVTRAQAEQSSFYNPNRLGP